MKAHRRWDDTEIARTAARRLESSVKHLFHEQKVHIAAAIARAYEQFAPKPEMKA